MDLPDFIEKNTARFLEIAEAADVLVVGFSLFPQRLILDSRYDEKDPPMVKVVQRLNSAEERLRELAKERPRFPAPRRFYFTMWPRSLQAMQDWGVWARLIRKCEASGHPKVTRDCELAWGVLVGLEQQETQQAIRGAGYKAMWERSNSA